MDGLMCMPPCTAAASCCDLFDTLCCYAIMTPTGPWPWEHFAKYLPCHERLQKEKHTASVLKS